MTQQPPQTPSPPPPLRLVFWETTTACNLACRHCRRLEPQAGPAPGELSTEQGRRLIADLAATARPILVFSGGEPLMRPDLYELLDEAHHAGLPTALATNATLVNRHVAQRISESGVRRVSVSLDGADPQTHDGFRGIPGCFGESLAGIAHLRAAGLDVQINVTISRHNADQLEAIYDLAVWLGAVALHAFMLVPVGCGVQLADSQMLTGAQYEQVLLRFHALSRRGELQTKATCAPHYQRILIQQGEKTVSDTVFPGCLAGSAVCFVSHRGDVFPCGYLPVAAGNVLEDRFADLWTSSPVFLRLRDQRLLTGKCGLCEFKSVCRGCRARAYAASGNELAEEPYCVYEPRSVARHEEGP